MPAADILSPADVAGLRALVIDLAMPDAFQLVRDTTVSDGAGGFTTVTVTVASGVCSLQTLNVGIALRENSLYGLIQSRVPYTVNVPYDLDARPSDRIIVDGRRFEIKGVEQGGNWAMVKTLAVEEIR